MVVFGATGEARPSGPAHEAGGSPVSSFGDQAALALASQSPRQWHTYAVNPFFGGKNPRCPCRGATPTALRGRANPLDVPVGVYGHAHAESSCGVGALE